MSGRRTAVQSLVWPSDRKIWWFLTWSSSGNCRFSNPRFLSRRLTTVLLYHPLCYELSLSEASFEIFTVLLESSAGNALSNTEKPESEPPQAQAPPVPVPRSVCGRSAEDVVFWEAYTKTFNRWKRFSEKLLMKFFLNTLCVIFGLAILAKFAFPCYMCSSSSLILQTLTPAARTLWFAKSISWDQALNIFSSFLVRNLLHRCKNSRMSEMAPGPPSNKRLRLATASLNCCKPYKAILYS